MATYGLLRYILWKQITGVFNVKILLQKNTAIFFRKLAKSKYNYFINVFMLPIIAGYDKAYLYDIPEGTLEKGYPDCCNCDEDMTNNCKDC